MKSNFFDNKTNAIIYSLSIGFIYGIIFDNMILGLSLGFLFGMAIFGEDKDKSKESHKINPSEKEEELNDKE